MQTRNAAAVYCVASASRSPYVCFTISILCPRELCGVPTVDGVNCISISYPFCAFCFGYVDGTSQTRQTMGKTGKVVSEEKYTRAPVPVTNACRLMTLNCWRAHYSSLRMRITKQQLFVVFRFFVPWRTLRAQKAKSFVRAPATCANAFCREIGRGDYGVE